LLSGRAKGNHARWDAVGVVGAAQAADAVTARLFDLTSTLGFAAVVDSFDPSHGESG